MKYNTNQLNAIARKLHQDGWEYVEDKAYPVKDNRRIGWWINPNHETKCRRTGDSRPWDYATESTFDIYSGHTIDELNVKSVWDTPEWQAIIARNKKAEEAKNKRSPKGAR